MVATGVGGLAELNGVAADGGSLIGWPKAGEDLYTVNNMISVVSASRRHSLLTCNERSLLMTRTGRLAPRIAALRRALTLNACIIETPYGGDHESSINSVKPVVGVPRVRVPPVTPCIVMCTVGPTLLRFCGHAAAIHDSFILMQ